MPSGHRATAAALRRVTAEFAHDSRPARAAPGGAGSDDSVAWIAEGAFNRTATAFLPGSLRALGRLAVLPGAPRSRARGGTSRGVIAAPVPPAPTGRSGRA